jgi:GntR family transcriptional regulator
MLGSLDRARVRGECGKGRTPTVSNGQPRYQEIEDWLTELCNSLPAGSLLPSEPELAARFSVSRMTARQAVQNLARAGRIDRRRGAGTFVAPPRLHRDEGILLSFTEDMRRRGMKTSSRVIRSEIVTSPDDAVALGLQPSSWVVKIERVRFADDVPLALERVRLPGSLSAVLDADLEHTSLHEWIRRAGHTIDHATGYVTARLADKGDAELLELTLPAALLVESRMVYDGNGRPLERTETAYVASRWVIDTGMWAQAAAESRA